MLIVLLNLLGFIAAVSLIAGVTAVACRLLTKSNALALTSGTLVMPVLICASVAYWVKTMDADDPAPGNVLMGNLLILAVVTPIAFVASYLSLRVLSRRASRNGS